MTFVFAVLLKPSPESNLETKIITILGHIAQRSLLILGYKRQFIRNAILESQYLILVLREIRGVRHA